MLRNAIGHTSSPELSAKLSFALQGNMEMPVRLNFSLLGPASSWPPLMEASGKAAGFRTHPLTDTMVFSVHVYIFFCVSWCRIPSLRPTLS